MSLYFLVLDPVVFQKQLVPPLASSWRQRSFAPCRSLCEELLPAARTFAESCGMGAEEPLLYRILGGLSFDQERWRTLVGEILTIAAEDIPDIETAPETLICLLACDHYCEEPVPRARFTPIDQILYGSRDLIFGSGFYRPEHAGINDVGDVTRLAGYLAAVDPGRWRPSDLAALRDLTDLSELVEELDYVRHWFPALQDLYRKANAAGQMIVCEEL
jgi:hypothetical protein